MTHRDDDLDVALLEPLLRQLVELIGIQATMAIVERCGGTLLNIPRQADQNALLLELVGAERAAILGRALGPDRLLIPKAQPALRDVRDRRVMAALQSRSVRQVAREFGLGERWVWELKRRRGVAEDNPTPDLFA